MPHVFEVSTPACQTRAQFSCYMASDDLAMKRVVENIDSFFDSLNKLSGIKSFCRSCDMHTSMGGQVCGRWQTAHMDW